MIFLHKVIFIDLFVPALKLEKSDCVNYREVAEWLKVLAWKASVPHKGTGGSNPFLSAFYNGIIRNNKYIQFNLFN
jgi:hypothetical protein